MQRNLGQWKGIGYCHTAAADLYRAPSVAILSAPLQKAAVSQPCCLILLHLSKPVGMGKQKGAAGGWMGVGIGVSRAGSGWVSVKFSLLIS